MAGFLLLEAFLTSFGMVALAEMGDKTQLLSFMLAARFRGRHVAIMLGILFATLANHWAAAALGGWIGTNVSSDVMRWILAGAFFAFAAWALVADKLDSNEHASGRYGAFATTLVAFFLAEMGDKTQVATIALGARYASVFAIVMGTTLGMMAANVPAVLMGETLTRVVPMKWMRRIAAALFAIFGALILLEA